MTTTMSTSKSAARRAILQTSRTRWNRTDNLDIVPVINSDTSKCDGDNVERWLTTISKDDIKPEVVLETKVKPIRRNESGEDDLALGVEASLYGRRSLKSVRDLLRSSQDPPALSRWNSFASNVSIPSDVSVMDVLNILQDDPEELLLDLGFGTEEPDFRGRIPARFLNYQSCARGISFQLFLEAQQNRMDVENEDVRNRFRQLEVLQQVTTTFSSLVGANTQDVDTSTASRMSAEARERRKRMVMILRRASKKSLSQAKTLQNQHMPPPLTSSALSGPESSGMPMVDKRIPSKRTRVSDNSCLSPLEEEQSINSDSAEPVLNSLTARGTSDLLKLDSFPSSAKESLQRPVESFELEEIQSFDEGSIPGSCNDPVDPGGERIGSYVMRTNSCQSDSSGFLEDPFIPALSQQNNPGPELMKMLNAISQNSTEDQQRRSEARETEDPSIDEQNCETESNQKHSLTAHYGKTVLGTADSETMFDSGELRKIISEKENSLSPDISKVSSNGVYTLAYFVQMDPVGYQTEICDRLQGSGSPDRRVYREGMSLFEELKSAEKNLHLSPTNLRTDVVDAFTNNLELGKKAPALDLMQESPASTQGKTVSSDAPFGHNSPTALKLRRESFSRRSWSDVITDNDSGTAQTPTTQTPFTSVDTSPPHLWNSEECSGDLGRLHTRSISLDTGLSYEEEDHRLQGALWAGAQRCFYCGSQIGYDSGWAKPHPELSPSLPYSLDELEDMVKCLRKFQAVLTEIEGRLEEEQASVIGSLSDSHREEVEDVLRLRAAVKHEAGMLEQQLSDLVHHYDDSIKMKLNRLMDEQSQLCTQLRIRPSNTPHSEPTSTRSVAIQCCLPPITSSPQRCVHHHCTCHGACQDPHRFPCQTQWEANCKPDRLDFVAFIKSLKNSLQHSINSNSLE
ncbi:coiled-coil domain-containing protein 129-like isoform X1 [Sinocyclocheilus rhinocerous]|uniref:Coiled-coil domain-containing protein 129-like n=1 Tax=Sinocyclocheilus rhinocerous TaxID=307959 RepID=A0A673M748_9TELE|nr:PREDICTED: coiled-coil domain-containing protein 129-like isoform X1 [Sinocyclocheilus rhinocerous]XP_016373621.1 PREDICTED: coiled-coil domain-containing protein 129-like isoform X2 [Sinocyclocheilus rhinocerous]XP_016373622.1 PREDICTED: coiled-coil domain-containing protein 129-like isoform X1 [Sinocyclocheilus rhinocerous]